MPLFGENPEEEGYWKGEELRRSTPFISGGVYENILNHASANFGSCMQMHLHPTKPRYALKDPDKKRRFFDELPETFTPEDAANIAVHYSFSQCTAMRYIAYFIGLKMNKIAYGLYRKSEK